MAVQLHSRAHHSAAAWVQYCRGGKRGGERETLDRGQLERERERGREREERREREKTYRLPTSLEQSRDVGVEVVEKGFTSYKIEWVVLGWV